MVEKLKGIFSDQYIISDKYFKLVIVEAVFLETVLMWFWEIRWPKQWARF